MPRIFSSFSLRSLWGRRSFWSLSLLAGALVGLGLACARQPSALRLKYPPRRPTCGMHIFHADIPALPAVPGWEDIGTFEVICHIDDSEATCFARVRAEACRMGGNVIYRLPVKVWRPREEVFGYRGMVAHTRVLPEHVADDAPDAPPPASAEEAAGPVVPLTGPAAPTAAARAAPAPPAALAPDAGTD
jgi:hypothetical protein